MTTTLTRHAIPPAIDQRRVPLFRRVGWAALIAVGPVAVGLLRVLLPYTAIDTLAAIADAVVAQPGPVSAVVWLGFLAVLALVPAVVWLGTTTRRRAPVLTGVALALAVPGYGALSMLVAADLVGWTAANAGLSGGEVGALFSSIHPAANVGVALFVPGHLLGTILLGVAWWRTGLVPRWVAGLTVVSQPLHPFSAVVLLSPELDQIAWLLTASGFAWAAWVLTDRLGFPRE